MAICVSASTNPDGSLKLVPEPDKTDLSTCSYVLQSGAEVAESSLANLTPAQGLEISMAVCALWALAWGIKQVANTLKGNANEEIE
ncbi:hypothetical protein [Undibacterium sp.]|jgi:hypothetical protein|uniref:hypothetical protein n=1 Tax=Undibacterium sp. TaxID=1914977 RepID=UPI002C5665F8|nr:hypothetical protein [Undibacterium sp.]HTD06234.1 hypothetical protein [Undibacterium sp.]